MAGEGSVVKRVRTRPDGTMFVRYIAQLSRGGRADRRYETETHTSRNAARAALERMRADRTAGIRPSSQSLGTFLRMWIDETVGPNISPNTIRGYEAVLTHLEPVAHLQLRDLTEEDLEVVFNRMTAQRKHQREATPAAAKTVRNAQLMLRTALSVATARGHVRRNVAKGVALRKVPKGTTAALTPGAAREVLAAVAGDRYEAGYALGMMALRQSEVLGLLWAELDLKRGSVHVTRQLEASGERARRVKLKTETSEGTVPLPPFVVARLQAHRLRQLEERAASGKETKDGLVFVTPDGLAVNGSWYSKHFTKLVLAAGLPRMTLHELRHGAASLLAGAGVHPRIAQELLRHASSTTTLDLYTHVTAAQQREAADVMERVVAG